MRYRLLKEFPNVSVGMTLIWVNEFSGYIPSCTNNGKQVVITAQIVENNPDWFEKDNCVFDSKIIHDMMQELQEQEDAFNAARKGLKNGCADERTFHGEYYRTFKDYQLAKFEKAINETQLQYFHNLAGTYYKKEIWQGIVNNVSDLLKQGVTTEEIGEYLKTLFEILGK